jgi:hypothetical protein
MYLFVNGKSGLKKASDMSTSPNSVAGEIPHALERSEVPLYFRQFRDSSVLRKLAHAGKGPLYQLIGRKAWYDTADIVSWLESRKRQGPPRTNAATDSGRRFATDNLYAVVRKGRGRPTKTEQRKRMQAEQALKA